MLGPEVTVDVGSLRVRSVDRADVLVHLRAQDGTTTLAVREAGTGRYAELPAPAVSSYAEPLALAADGSRILFQTAARTRPVVHHLATGIAELLPHLERVHDRHAAFGADAGTVVTLADEGDDAVLSTVDTAGGVRRRLWSGPGTASVDPVVSCSPGGDFIAATYVTPEDSFATVVLRRDGTPAVKLEGTEISGGSNRAWLDPHHLLVVEEYSDEDPWPIIVLDPATGRQRTLAPTRAGPILGTVGGRLLHRVDGEGVFTSDLDGSDLRPLLVVGPRYEVAFFDTALRANG